MTKKKMVLVRNPENKEMYCLPSSEHVDKSGNLVAGKGYDSWEILEHRNGHPPEDHSWIDGQGFVPNKVESRDKENRRLASLTRLEFMEELEKRLSAVPEKN